jgi:thioredoxin reductase
MPISEVLVIGAGPYGLSISAHLRGLGVEHIIVGRPMDSWRTRMPVGMVMKSEPYASEIASPRGGYGLAEYSQAHGLDYVNRVGPVTLERFLSYADWYTEQLVPDVRDLTVTGITAQDGGFRVAFADGAPVTARQVVVASGVMPYAYIPPELSGLSPDLVTHASDHHDLGAYKGRKVAVVGAGQSALETAALLHEQGADVTVIARGRNITWNDPNPAHVNLIGYLRRPVVQLCEGWRCVVWNSPELFRLLPEEMRITKARTVLGPSGAWWLKDRVDGVVEVLTGHRVKEAVPQGSGVQLVLDGPGQSAIDVDHVIAGTGFRPDISRLDFLTEGLRGKINTLNGSPAVSRGGESSVPGLYFAGAHTAVSLGPSARFVAGTHHMAAPTAKSLARRARAGRNRAGLVQDDLPVGEGATL